MYNNDKGSAIQLRKTMDVGNIFGLEKKYNL